MQNPPNTPQTKPIVNDNTEFAEKLPLVPKKTIRIFLSGCLLIVGLMVILFSVNYVIKKSKVKPAPTPEAPVEEITETPTPTTELSIFAYVKNNNSIFVVNEDGKDKNMILEIPVSAEGSYTALSWKSKNNLSYSKCISTGCEIMTYDINQKSIRPEISTSANSINDFAFSPDQKYLAYVATTGENANLRLKVGTIDTSLRAVTTPIDLTFTKTKALFNNSGQYVVFSLLEKESIPMISDGKNPVQIITYPVIYIYQLNGVQIDQIVGGSDPFFIDDNILGYKKDNKLVYKTIGESEESEITPFIGYNPEASPDKTRFAYWSNENGGKNVILGLYDSTQSIHRNILRGVILPVWISVDKIAGIQADSCFGEQCLLYKFQTASLVIVDITNGEVIPVDQGKSISKVVFKKYAD